MRIAVAARLEYLDDQEKYFVNKSYVDIISAYGHTPVIVSTNAETILSCCDGFLCPGGYDILPFYFQENIQKHASFYQRAQDELDFHLLDICIKQNIPILGICRGIQLINVYFQGSLYQDMNKDSHADHAEHPILLSSNSFLSGLYECSVIVNSYHHQSIKKLGDGLIPCAWSYDGYIEAITHNELPIIAVQWHPERMENDRIFPYFFHQLACYKN